MAIVVGPPRDNSAWENFMTRYMQNRQQKRTLEQQQSQFDQTHALNVEATGAQVGRDKSATALTDSTRELNVATTGAAGVIEQARKLYDAGELEGAARFVQEQIAANPQLAPALVGYAKSRMRTGLDDFAKQQSDLAGSGSEDVQARNFAFKKTTGEQMQPYVFGDQQQRQAGPQPYADFVKREGGAMPTAGQQLQADTQIQIGRENNATQLAATGMRAEAVGARPSSAIEKRSLAFYLRAKDAVDQLEGVDPQTGKPLHESVGNKNIIGQAWLNNAPNMLQPEENQLYTQAQRQFTEARLRKDSGAAIPDHEFENDRRTYFAQPGDSPQVIERKKMARQNLLNSLKMESGRAYGEYYGEGGDGSVTQPSGASGQFKFTATGPNGEKIGSNDGVNWQPIGGGR